MPENLDDVNLEAIDPADSDIVDLEDVTVPPANAAQLLSYSSRQTDIAARRVVRGRALGLAAFICGSVSLCIGGGPLFLEECLAITLPFYEVAIPTSFTLAFTALVLASLSQRWGAPRLMPWLGRVLGLWWLLTFPVMAVRSENLSITHIFGSWGGGAAGRNDR